MKSSETLINEIEKEILEPLKENNTGITEAAILNGLEIINKVIASDKRMIDCFKAINEKIKEDIKTSEEMKFNITESFLVNSRKKLINAIKEYTPAYANYLALSPENRCKNNE